MKGLYCIFVNTVKVSEVHLFWTPLTFAVRTKPVKMCFKILSLVLSIRKKVIKLWTDIKHAQTPD